MSGQIELQSEHVAKREISAHNKQQLYVCQLIPFSPPLPLSYTLLIKFSHILKFQIMRPDQLHHPRTIRTITLDGLSACWLPYIALVICLM